MNKKGVTIFEVLIASIILVLLMLGMANLFVAGKRYIQHARSRMAAAELQKAFLDPLQMGVRQDEWVWGDTSINNCLSTGNCPDITRNIDGINYTAHTVITQIGDLRRATTTITWQEPAP
jgi:Tfp pilus assembly protein PilV